MHVAHHGYSAAVVLIAVSTIALAVPSEDWSRDSIGVTLLLLTAFLYLLWTMLSGR